MQHGVASPVDQLSELVREIWKPLTPSIDYTLARILGYAARVTDFTPYRLAKELGLNYGTAYMKTRQAAERRLVLAVADSKTGSRYGITVKGCIAGFVAGAIDRDTFLSCVHRAWGLARFDNVRAEEVLSFLALLGRVIALRGLDILRTNICFVEEAAAIVFHYVASTFLPSVIMEGHADAALKNMSERLGLSTDVLFNGIRLSLCALQGIIPPTVVTENHRVFLFVRGAHFIPLASECKLKCKYFARSFGVGCPRLYREVASRLAEIAAAGQG